MFTIVIAILTWRKIIDDMLVLGLAVLIDAVLLALFCGMMLSFIPK